MTAARAKVGNLPTTPAEAPPVVPIGTTPAVETEPTAAEHPCDVCPLRSTAGNQTFDYCEGCTRVERRCPGCREFKAQAGWWWGPGAFWSATTWVCADCRFPPLDPDAAARYPAVAATHPALADLAADRGRFATRLELDGLERRFEAAQALARAASMLAGDPAALPLARMAACLRDADFDGRLDVDTSDVDVPARQRVTVALHNAAYSTHTPQAASGPLAGLMRVWDRWVEDQLPARSRPPSEQERRDRERAALRRGRERVTGG